MWRGRGAEIPKRVKFTTAETGTSSNECWDGLDLLENAQTGSQILIRSHLFNAFLTRTTDAALPAAPSGGLLPWLPGEKVAATWEGKEVRSSRTRGPGGETVALTGTDPTTITQSYP